MGMLPETTSLKLKEQEKGTTIVGVKEEGPPGKHFGNRT